MAQFQVSVLGSCFQWLATGRTLKESSAGRSSVISIIIGSTVLAERFRKRLDRRGESWQRDAPVCEINVVLVRPVNRVGRVLDAGHGFLLPTSQPRGRPP